MKWGLLVVLGAVLSACISPGDRVQRITTPGGAPTFVTRCKRNAACLADAEFTCPGGFIKLGVKDDVSVREMSFECHGKANW